MKILHINRNYVFNALHQKLIDELAANDDIENTVFSPTSEEQDVDYIRKENLVVVKCFKLRDSFFYHHKQRKIYRALKQKIDLPDFHMIHAYTLFTDGNCAMKVKKEFGIPYAAAIRNTDVNDFFKRLPFLRHRGIKIMQNADTVFFLSETYKSIVMNHYVPRNKRDELLKKAVVIPNGVDDFWLDNIYYREKDRFAGGDKTASQTINAVYAGRIDKNKNILCTVKALKLLRKDGYAVNFHVVGKIEDNSVYEEVIQEGFVHYHQPMDKESLINMYRENDVYIMPSFTETFGLSYVEAMTQGMPVIYTLGQGFDGQFPEGEVGYHVNPNRPIDVANAVKKIISNYNQLTSNCSEKCKKYNWKAISDQYHDIYSKFAL